MKKYLKVMAAAMAAAIICSFSGCSGNEKNELRIEKDASLTGLEWGMSVKEAADSFAYLDKEAAASESGYIRSDEFEIFGKKAVASAGFSKYKKSDYPFLSEDTSLMLSSLNILVYDWSVDSAVDILSETLGDRETKQTGFYDYDGEYGIKYSGDLDESEYYWHADKTLIDIVGLPKLMEIYPDMSEKALMQDLYDTWEYTVYVSAADENVAISISAEPTVIKQLLEGSNVITSN